MQTRHLSRTSLGNPACCTELPAASAPQMRQPCVKICAPRVISKAQHQPLTTTLDYGKNAMSDKSHFCTCHCTAECERNRLPCDAACTACTFRSCRAQHTVGATHIDRNWQHDVLTVPLAADVVGGASWVITAHHLPLIITMQIVTSSLLTICPR